MKTNKTVVFDLDGTLLYTLQDLADSVNAALEYHGFPTHPLRRFSYFVGNGGETMVRRALPADADENMFSRVYEMYSKLYASGWCNKTKPYDGIQDMLKNLRDNGYTLAVVSNKAMERTEECIDHFFPKTFDVVMGQMKGFPLKPDPACVFAALAEVDGEPENAFFIGDTKVDVETGCRAGIYTAGAMWGFRTARELLDAGADVLCRNPAEAEFCITEFFKGFK